MTDGVVLAEGSGQPFSVRLLKLGVDLVFEAGFLIEVDGRDLHFLDTSEIVWIGWVCSDRHGVVVCWLEYQEVGDLVGFEFHGCLR